MAPLIIQPSKNQHLDVEGFELSVLKGAEKLILSDQPVISFEQHISKEDVGAVSEYLKSFDYRVFMLNEVLPGCEFLIFAKVGAKRVLLH